MCYYLSLESLPSFGISDVNRLLQTEGYSLSKLDSLPPESWKYAYIPLCFTYSDSLTGERRKGREVSLYLKRDGDGLYLEIRYSVRLQDRERNRLLRYYLTRRESNLIPGSFRYYFLDPYGEEEDSLCEKLYYYPETGDFYPRSYLSTSGVLYAQQRRGRLDRYYLGLTPKLLKGDSTRYRKKHYRGKVTPFWRRYQELKEREEERFIEFVVGSGYADGLRIPPDVRMEVCRDFQRHSGRKSPTRREKAS